MFSSQATPFKLLLGNNIPPVPGSQEMFRFGDSVPRIMIRKPCWPARDIGGFLWPIHAKGGWGESKSLDCNEFININTHTSTPKFKLLRIKPIDIISIFLCISHVSVSKNITFGLIKYVVLPGAINTGAARSQR